jgi:hypothetical protein
MDQYHCSAERWLNARVRGWFLTTHRELIEFIIATVLLRLLMMVAISELEICGAVRSSTLRPALSPPLLCRLVDQKVVKFLPTFDRSNKPTRSCATTGPRLARWTTIFGWDLPSSQCASTASDNPCHGNCLTHPLQLLFNLSPTPVKHFVNPLPQVHERFNGHPC